MKNHERMIVIYLLAGGTPRQLRSAIKKLKLMDGPAMAPRVAVVWLRNDTQRLGNAEIARQIAAFIPASTIHVRDLGDISHAVGPNYSR